VISREEAVHRANAVILGNVTEPLKIVDVFLLDPVEIRGRFPDISDEVKRRHPWIQRKEWHVVYNVIQPPPGLPRRAPGWVDVSVDFETGEACAETHDLQER